MDDATADVVAAKGRHPAYQPRVCAIAGCGMPGHPTSGTLSICYRHGDEIADGWQGKPQRRDWVYLTSPLTALGSRRASWPERLIGRVKVGTTSNIERRMLDLGGLFCFAAVPGGRDVESEIHRRLRAMGLAVWGQREWFRDDPRVWEVLAEYASPHAVGSCLDANEAARDFGERMEDWEWTRRREDERRAAASEVPSP